MYTHQSVKVPATIIGPSARAGLMPAPVIGPLIRIPTASAAPIASGAMLDCARSPVATATTTRTSKKVTTASTPKARHASTPAAGAGAPRCATEPRRRSVEPPDDQRGADGPDELRQ